MCADCVCVMCVCSGGEESEEGGEEGVEGGEEDQS
jgi:hypothetical protein